MQKRRAFAGLLTKRQLLFGKYAITFCFLPDHNLLKSILGCSLSAMVSLTTIKVVQIVSITWYVSLTGQNLCFLFLVWHGKYFQSTGLFDQMIHMRDKADTAAILRDLTPKVTPSSILHPCSCSLSICILEILQTNGHVFALSILLWSYQDWNDLIAVDHREYFCICFALKTSSVMHNS